MLVLEVCLIDFKYEKQSAYVGTNASKIFEVLKPVHKLDNYYKTLF